MKTTRIILTVLASAACCYPVRGRCQGFIYDQQSSTTIANAFASQPIPNSVSIGQSFTPTLTGIDFVQLAFRDSNLGNSLGATLFVNLHATSITGPILGTTESVSMPEGFGRSGPNGEAATFLFAATVDLQPGTLYYLEPIVQSGDTWQICYGEYFYFQGTLIVDGAPVSATDLWFREGTYSVPEPSAFALVLLGAGAVAWFRRIAKRP